MMNNAYMVWRVQQKELQPMLLITVCLIAKLLMRFVCSTSSQSCWQVTKGVGGDGGGGFIDMCILHEGKGVEIHLNECKKIKGFSSWKKNVFKNRDKLSF